MSEVQTLLMLERFSDFSLIFYVSVLTAARLSIARFPTIAGRNSLGRRGSPSRRSLLAATLTLSLFHPDASAGAARSARLPAAKPSLTLAPSRC